VPNIYLLLIFNCQKVS